MLLFIAVVCVAVFEYFMLYDPKMIDRLQKLKIPGFRNMRAMANSLNEKWGLMFDSFKDELFNRHYNYHVDASSTTLVRALTDETAGTGNDE